MTRRSLLFGLLLVVTSCANNTVVIVQPSSTAPAGDAATTTTTPISLDTVELSVSGSAMMPTLQDGDTIVVDRAAYLSSSPRAGDVIVFNSVESSGTRALVKRIVGLPGETLEYRSCRLYVNDHLINEAYLDPAAAASTLCGGDQPLITLPADGYYVLGDNRGGSKDSRDLGSIAFADIVGKVILVVTPDGLEHMP